MDQIGIDVHKKDSQFCILSEGGELIAPRIRTTPERFADVLGDRPRARILLEASTSSFTGGPTCLSSWRRVGSTSRCRCRGGTASPCG